ncbi:hypothetical protein FQR65_LT17355 [Abscondita terminalis]|nr:hypothetical protein FQR65_LT17355 [Abscondita terminalis]
MFHFSKLPEELQIIAKNELNEVPERTEEDISYIRKWLLKQPHINARTDDHTILTYLRGCKFSLEQTKRKLELYYTIKTAFPSVFKNRDPLLPKIQFIFKRGFAAVLPQVLNGSLSILCRVEHLTPEIMSPIDFIKLSTIITTVTLQECVSGTVVGRIILLDLKNMSPKFFTLITPTLIKQYLTCHLNAYPLRIKRVHLLNVPAVMVSVMNVLKMLSPKKLKTRITYDMCGRENTILQYLPLSVLPTEYGGTAGPFADMCEQFYVKIKSYRQWLIEEDQYGCDESKRPATSKVDIDLFSIDGSFRKLNVD